MITLLPGWTLMYVFAAARPLQPASRLTTGLWTREKKQLTCAYDRDINGVRHLRAFFTDPFQGLQKRKGGSCYRECKSNWVKKKAAALSLVITSTEDTECLQVPNSAMQAKSHWKLLASAQKRSSMTRIARFFRSHELPLLRPARPAPLSSECSCSHWSILAGGNGLFETRYVGGLGTKTNPQHRTLKIPAPIQPK